MYITVLIAVAVVLLLTLIAGLARILTGPARGDRMLAAQLFGTTGVAILLILADALAMPALRNVALAFVLLALVNAAVFVQTANEAGSDREPLR